MNFKANLEQFMSNLKILTARDIQTLVSMPTAIAAVHHADAKHCYWYDHGATAYRCRSTHPSITYFFYAGIGG
jgi:hypothetical protein